ncbi:MAG: YbaK/EbsC family protein [Candidatus Aenigmarchaeota archaeon]|nr:YbaK/EbsC family protein [Candidatus Aenigmarchaeota archaeon]
MNMNLHNLLQGLKENKLKFRLLDTKTTMISSRDVEKVFDGNPREIWKTLVLTDEKNFYAAFLCGRDRLNLHKLEKVFGVNGLRLAKAKELKEKFKIQPGEVCPLTINIPIVCDYSIRDFEKVNFGSGDMMYGIEMKVDDILKFLGIELMDIRDSGDEPEQNS